MSYVDGYVLSVPRKKLDQYRKMAEKAGKIWKEHGALDYKECVQDDVPAKGFVKFTTAAKAKKGEVVVFAYVLFKSRAQRDKVNQKVMKDPRLATMCDPNDMPFDCKRMVYGGFKVMVDPR